MLSEEIQGPAKEFIEFVVQLIPRRQAGVESGIRGGRTGGARGIEGSGEQGWRVNVKGWQLHQGSLIENNTAKSQLDRILFKFTSILPISQCYGVCKMGACNNRHLFCLSSLRVTSHTPKIKPRSPKTTNPEANE